MPGLSSRDYAGDDCRNCINRFVNRFVNRFDYNFY